jgi:hypothetical protein
MVEAHYNLYLRLKVAQGLEEVTRIAEKGLMACDWQAFIVLTAFSEGWGVALKMLTPGYIQSEEEDKQVQQAKRLQALEESKAKAGKASKGLQGASPSALHVMPQGWGQSASSSAPPMGYNGVMGVPQVAQNIRRCQVKIPLGAVDTLNCKVMWP